jgi:hypothetical protein
LIEHNRFPPRIKSGAGFFGIMLQVATRAGSLSGQAGLTPRR